ncbi:MAG TPA: hypothetical protein VGK08_06320 [Thermoanaerobaculia bacterium]
MKPAQVDAFHSPRIGMPERRKKSSGASRPSIVKTTSFASVDSWPASSSSTTCFGSTRMTCVPRARRSEPGCFSSVGMKAPVAVVTRSEEGCSTPTAAEGFFSSIRIFSMFSGLGRENSFLR